MNNEEKIDKIDKINANNHNNEIQLIISRIKSLEKVVENNRIEVYKVIDKIEGKIDTKLLTMEQKIDRELKEINTKLDNKLKEILDKLDEQNKIIEVKFNQQKASLSIIEQEKNFSKGFIKALVVMFTVVTIVAGIYFKKY